MIVPNREELVTASEPVTRPDISSGSITLLEMTEDQIERARERENNKTIGLVTIPSPGVDSGLHGKQTPGFTAYGRDQR